MAFPNYLKVQSDLESLSGPQVSAMASGQIQSIAPMWMINKEIDRRNRSQAPAQPPTQTVASQNLAQFQSQGGMPQQPPVMAAGGGIVGFDNGGMVPGDSDSENYDSEYFKDGELLWGEFLKDVAIGEGPADMAFNLGLAGLAATGVGAGPAVAAKLGKMGSSAWKKQKAVRESFKAWRKWKAAQAKKKAAQALAPAQRSAGRVLERAARSVGHVPKDLRWSQAAGAGGRSSFPYPVNQELLRQKGLESLGSKVINYPTVIGGTSFGSAMAGGSDLLPNSWDDSDASGVSNVYGPQPIQAPETQFGSFNERLRALTDIEVDLPYEDLIQAAENAASNPTGGGSESGSTNDRLKRANDFDGQGQFQRDMAFVEEFATRGKQQADEAARQQAQGPFWDRAAGSLASGIRSLTDPDNASVIAAIASGISEASNEPGQSTLGALAGMSRHLAPELNRRRALAIQEQNARSIERRDRMTDEQNRRQNALQLLGQLREAQRAELASATDIDVANIRARSIEGPQYRDAFTRWINSDPEASRLQTDINNLRSVLAIRTNDPEVRARLKIAEDRLRRKFNEALQSNQLDPLSMLMNSAQGGVETFGLDEYGGFSK